MAISKIVGIIEQNGKELCSIKGLMADVACWTLRFKELSMS